MSQNMLLLNMIELSFNYNYLISCVKVCSYIHSLA